MSVMRQILALLFFLNFGFASADQPLPRYDELFEELGITSGDLIFREGVTLISDIVRGFEEDSHTPFSHVGIVIYEEEEWRVLHAAPSESPDTPSGVMIDPLAYFLAPERSAHFALYRISSSITERQAALNHAYQRLGEPFHYKEEEGTYCTSLIDDAWKAIGYNLTFTFTPITLPLFEGEYLFPSHMVKSPHLIKLYSTYDTP